MHTLPGIGIFGTNEVVKVLVPILREKGFVIAAIWGKNMKEAEEIAKELKISFFTNKIDDVLLCKHVDMIFVLCQPYLHPQISVKALGIGKHVLCERPIGISVADAQKMVRASEYYPSLIALVNHSLRFLPAYVHLKKSINEGLIGPLSIIDVSVKISSLLSEGYDWLCSAEMGGGVLNLIGSHVIDLIHFLTGKKAKRVHAIVRTFKQQTDSINGIRAITAPDFCNFQMELQGGLLVVANLQSNQCCRNAFEQDVTIVGRDGSLIVAGGDLICLRKKVNDTNGEFKEDKLYVEVQDLRADCPSSSLPRPYIKGMTKMVGALKEAFATEKSGWAKEAVSSAANFNDALYVQAVLEAIRKSSDSRTWVKIDMEEIQT